MNHEIHEKHEKILYKNECYIIHGAVFDVYRERGVVDSFLEAVREIL